MFDIWPKVTIIFGEINGFFGIFKNYCRPCGSITAGSKGTGPVYVGSLSIIVSAKSRSETSIPSLYVAVTLFMAGTGTQDGSILPNSNTSLANGYSSKAESKASRLPAFISIVLYLLISSNFPSIIPSILCGPVLVIQPVATKQSRDFTYSNVSRDGVIDIYSHFAEVIRISSFLITCAAGGNLNSTSAISPGSNL